MKLGVITTSFPRYSGDHAGSFVFELCHALVERGHTLDVIAPEPRHGEPPRWPGITTHWTPYLRPRARQLLAYRAGIPENVTNNPCLILQAPLLVAAMAQAIFRHSLHWDGLISHWLFPAGFLGGFCRHIPHVAIAHSGDVWLLKALPPPFGSLVTHRIISSTTATAVVNPTLAAQLRSLAPKTPSPKIHIIHLGPDSFAPIQPRRREQFLHRLGEIGFRKNRNEFLVSTVSRLVPVKGLDVLLEALARPESRGITALIAGDGPERHRLEARANELGVKAFFIGAIDAIERTALFELTDLLVVPSRILPGGRSEGTPQVVLEGMACGVPIVASNLGGIPWALGNAGLVVTPDSPGALADALSALRDDPARRRQCAAHGRKRALERGWSKSAASLEDLLTQTSLR